MRRHPGDAAALVSGGCTFQDSFVQAFLETVVAGPSLRPSPLQDPDPLQLYRSSVLPPTSEAESCVPPASRHAGGRRSSPGRSEALPLHGEAPTAAGAPITPQAPAQQQDGNIRAHKGELKVQSQGSSWVHQGAADVCGRWVQSLLHILVLGS